MFNAEVVADELMEKVREHKRSYSAENYLEVLVALQDRLDMEISATEETM